jgi:alpha-glucosidase
MPWEAGVNGEASVNAGFSTASPWLPLNADWPVRNVAVMAEDPASLLTLYRRLLAVRCAHPALAIGDFMLLDSEGDVLAYERRHGAQRLVVALNLSGQSQRLELPESPSDWRLLLSTSAESLVIENNVLLLRGDEGVILAA